MKKLWIATLLVCGITLAQGRPGGLPYKAQDRIVKEVRHELVMLPYYGVFDNLVFKVDGSTVTLLGQVTRPTLKSDAGKRGEGYRRSGEGGQPDRGAAAFAQ